MAQTVPYEDAAEATWEGSPSASTGDQKRRHDEARQALRGSWSSLQDGSKVLFRILGLSIIVAGLKSLRHFSLGKGYAEPTKIAIRQSRTTVLLRALIRIVPLSVALCEIILNWNTYFVGATIRNLAYYQFGAKIHEMTAQASLAAIVFTCISTNGSLLSTNCLSWNALTYDVDCPSSDWQAIQEALDLTSHSVPKREESYHGPVGPHGVDVTGRSSLRKLIISSQFLYNGSEKVFYANVASAQQVAVANALTATGILWGLAMSNTSSTGHGSVLNQLDAVHSIKAGYNQPYTSVFCEYDIIRGPHDNDPVTFPAYSGVSAQLAKTAMTAYPAYNLTLPDLTKSGLLDTAGPLDEFRLRWVELPFNSTDIGATILTPRSPQNATQEILMCSVGAGWGLSTMNMSTLGGGAAPILSQVEDTNAMSKALREGHNSNPYFDPGSSPAEELAIMQSGFFWLPTFPQRPIRVTEEWARYLNPAIEYLNTTVFNQLMGPSLTPDSNPHRQALAVLAAMVANGLSRVGSTSQLQGNVKQVTEPDQSIGLDGNYWFAGKGNNVFQVDPAESKDWVKFRVSSTVYGYAYNTHGKITKLAVGLLLAYCLVAVAHILYAGISGLSSTCWDSIGEVTALAMNSTPTAVLRNTCAGITELNIFKLPVRILAFRDAEGDGEHLELVFGTLDEKTLENKTIKANRVYGTMPNTKVRSKVE